MTDSPIYMACLISHVQKKDGKGSIYTVGVHVALIGSVDALDFVHTNKGVDIVFFYDILVGLLKANLGVPSI